MDELMKINLNSLKRHDASILQIIHRASHVLVYQHSSSGEWTKLNVEGALFIVEREANAGMTTIGLVVLNRLDTQNFMIPFDPSVTKFQSNAQFLTIRESLQKIDYGFWFHDLIEILKFENMLYKLSSMQPTRQKEVTEKPPVVKQLNEEEVLKKLLGLQTASTNGNHANNNNNEEEILKQLLGITKSAPNNALMTSFNLPSTVSASNQQQQQQTPQKIPISALFPNLQPSITPSASHQQPQPVPTSVPSSQQLLQLLNPSQSPALTETPLTNQTPKRQQLSEMNSPGTPSKNLPFGVPLQVLMKQKQKK